jgi:hypothetical protein
MIDSFLSGGLTGLLGTGLTYLMDYFKRKQDAALRLEEAKENRLAQESEERKIKILADSNVQVAVAQGEAATSVASYDNDKATYTVDKDAPKSVKLMMGFVDFLRGIIRPGTTIGYGALFAWLVILAVSSVTLAKLAETQSDKLIDAAIYLATTTTLWWFGVRPMSKGK